MVLQEIAEELKSEVILIFKRCLKENFSKNVPKNILNFLKNFLKFSQNFIKIFTHFALNLLTVFEKFSQ